MSKELLTLEDVQSMIVDAGVSNIIVWAIPVMLSLVFLEFILGVYHKREAYNGLDFLASLSVGVGNLLVTGVTKIFTFGLILFFYNLVPWSIPHTWWSYIACFVWLDFWRYVSHRISHQSRFWWATHIVHHSSEKYNFSVSFRLSWIQQLKFIFFIPVAIAGFNPIVFFVCHQVAILYQFWIHTEFIKKLPAPIEFFFVTPSHHRVHHARNEKYLDKNYGSTFIIWDRMFGTFQPEEETPEYGITKPVNSYNPVYLVFHEAIDIVKDIFRSRSLSEAYLRTFTRPSQLEAMEKRLEEQQKKKLEHS